MLRRRLNDELTLIRRPLFPAVFGVSARANRVTVGIGGNIGDVVRRFEHLLFFFQRDRQVDLIATAPILKNPPFGFSEQADFLNSVIVLQTNLQPRAFMRYLLHVERRFGRIRSFPNAPRTLDLDILFFDHRHVDHPELTVPHPHWHERESVVIPLSHFAAGRR